MESKMYFGEQWSPLLDAKGKSVNCQGRAIYVRTKQQDKFRDIAKAAEKNFHQLYLSRQILSLKGAGFFSSLVNKYRSTDRVLQLEGGKLVYAIQGGDVFLKDILVDFSYQSGQPVSAGCYKVQQKESGWVADVKEGQRGYIDTKHAAVNGAAKDIDRAAKYIPAFIRRGYGENALNNSYNLFYVPCNGLGGEWRALVDTAGITGGTQAAKKLADALKMTANRGNDTCWTIHEHGHFTFKQALRILVDKKIDLSNQTVFYANPTANLELLDRLRRKSGMKMAETRILMNDLNVRQGIISGNIFSENVVSCIQLREMGEDFTKGRTWSQWTDRLVDRVGIIPGGVPGWAKALFIVAGSNKPHANQKVIENPGHAISHLRGRL